MFTFILLCGCLLAATIAMIVTTVVLGGTFIAIFGDVALCILIVAGIVWIAKKIFNKD